MKKVLSILVIAVCVASFTSCAKKCSCVEKDADGNIIREYEEKQIKVLNVKMPCSYFDNSYTAEGGTISCR